jgi:ligand-binding sensor domain-containing protein/signal transduction histidine kinase
MIMERAVQSWACSMALLACLGLVAIPVYAKNINSSPSPVPQAQLESAAVRVPVSDGHDLRFARLLRSQGLSQQRVTHIVQDDRGFLWFGTQNGLNRYDGYHFRVFRHDASDPRSPCGFNVPALFKDPAGKLWIGCDGSVDRYEPMTESFVHYPVQNPNTETPVGSVAHISQDHAGRLWLSTASGLYQLDPGTGKVRRFSHDPSDPFSLSSDAVKSTGEDRTGTFWVATAEGLDAFDRNRGRVTLHLPLRESRDFSFYEDTTGVFWILYASGNGLAVLDRKTHRLTPYSFVGDEVQEMPLTGVSSILEDRDGTLWIGSFSNGLLKFDRQHLRFTRFRHDPANPDSLPEDRITTLFEDREGNIWVGLGATEPAYFARRPLPFTKLPFDAGNLINLGEKLVNVLYEDRAGALWLGTTGALDRLDRANGRYTSFEIPGRGITTDVLSLAQDSSGAMWVGTSGFGLYRLNPRSGEIQRVRYTEDEGPAAIVTALQLDRSGVLWVATMGGLYRLDPSTLRFTTVLRSLGLYKPPGAMDERGSLWWATNGADVLRVDPDSGRITTFRHAVSEHGEFINTILVDHTGSVWLGMQTGVDRFDPETGQVSHFTQKDGLASDVVSCILEDPSGALWMGTGDGLSRLDASRRVFTSYGPADGLPGPDFGGWGACFPGRDGEMYFGGFAGAAVFRPENVVASSYTPPIALTAFRLFGEIIPGGQPPLAQAIDYTRALRLSYEQNSFSLEFSALAFRSPASSRYRYKLEGLDKDWHEVGSEQRLASYTTLPPATYRFRVQAATDRGPWSEPGRAVDITILPAWWNTWSFRGLIGMLLVAAAAGLYLLRVRHISQQFAIRLEERLSERTRIARELHDSLLQGVQGLMIRLHAVRELLPGRPADAAHALRDALQSGAQAIAEGRAAVQDLRAATLPASDLAEALVALGPELLPEGSAQQPSYHVLVEGKSRPLMPLVRDDIYRIAREAVRNAVQHARARRIEVELVYGEQSFCLRTRDDGIGVDAQVLEASRRGGHWGFQGMHERAKSFGAHLELWSEHGSGTELLLEIPAAVAYGRGTTHASSATQQLE